MSPVKRAVLSTLAYRDIFDYPLTEIEVWRGLISHRSFTRQQVKKTLDQLLKQTRIGEQGRFYFLPGREELVSKRRAREKEAKKKFRQAKKWRLIFRFIPGVWGVWVTGSVAQGNATLKDDVDLLVVTAPDQLWWARFWVWLALSLGRKRRRPNQTRAVDLFCANLFLAAGELTMADKRRNLFTAVELVGAKLVWQRPFLGETPLLTSNPWVTDYLPHVEIKPGPTWQSFPSLGASWRNKFFYWAERWYLSRRQTREEVDLGKAFFHPRNTASLVKKKFYSRLNQLGLEPERGWFE